MRFGPFTRRSPSLLGTSDSIVAGSTTLTAMPGSGLPTVPGLLPVCVSRPALKSGVLTQATGASSVHPYPSSSSVPNFSWNALATDSRNFSAPASTKRRDANSSWLHLRV